MLFPGPNEGKEDVLACKGSKFHPPVALEPEKATGYLLGYSKHWAPEPGCKEKYLSFPEARLPPSNDCTVEGKFWLSRYTCWRVKR